MNQYWSCIQAGSDQIRSDLDDEGDDDLELDIGSFVYRNYFFGSFSFSIIATL